VARRPLKRKVRTGSPLAQFGTTVVVIPPAEVIGGKFHAVAANMEDPRPAFHDVLGLMERIHASSFERMPEYKGRERYDLTGRTRRSLTMPHAYGAIRGVTKQQVHFGTRVWYSHFLTKGPHDPELGQVRKQPPGEGRSAVLVFPRGTKKAITSILMSHYVEPVKGPRERNLGRYM
jgi:hypothetical protein